MSKGITISLVGSFYYYLSAFTVHSPFNFSDVNSLAIPPHEESIHIVVPVSDFVCCNNKGMAIEHDSKCLDPCVVACPSCWSSSYEVCIDLQVLVRNNSKVSSLCSMEVEHDSVTSNKAWVVTERTISIAFGFPDCQRSEGYKLR